MFLKPTVSISFIQMIHKCCRVTLATMQSSEVAIPDNLRFFLLRYPEIVEAQEKMWEARFQQLCSALRLDHARIVRGEFAVISCFEGS